MTTAPEPAATSAIQSARSLADAVLYEGYVLYPYRASAEKNQVRWQWGVLMPPQVATHDPSERSSCRTQVVVDGAGGAVQVTVRFLHVQQRRVERATGAGYENVDRLDVGPAAYAPWDEAREHELVVKLPLQGPHREYVDVPGGSEVELLRNEAHEVVGRLVRTWEPIQLTVTGAIDRPVSPYPVTLVSVSIENSTPMTTAKGSTRVDWLRRALVACHLLLEVDGATFVSQLDPPEWARGFVAGCDNDGVFPVLAGPSGQQHVMLSSPIILYDHAELAAESTSAFFDALEVDELLSLRTLTLSEDEKREVRGTDPRTAALLGEVEDMPADLWERLHGTVRYLDAMTAAMPTETDVPSPTTLEVPWWDPGSDASVDPEHDSVRIGEVDVRRGTKVVLRPGVRRADPYDMFLAGLRATVAAVLSDVDGKTHLAVSVDEDPGADLKVAHGRYLYFAPDEVEPIRVSVDGGV